MRKSVLGCRNSFPTLFRCHSYCFDRWHTSQPTRRRDRARRTGFSSSFTYSRVAPNLFLSLRQRNLLFLVCVSIQGVIAWKETTPQCRFVALTFYLFFFKGRIFSLNVFLKTVTRQKMLNFEHWEQKNWPNFTSAVSWTCPKNKLMWTRLFSFSDRGW